MIGILITCVICGWHVTRTACQVRSPFIFVQNFQLWLQWLIVHIGVHSCFTLLHISLAYRENMESLLSELGFSHHSVDGKDFIFDWRIHITPTKAQQLSRTSCITSRQSTYCISGCRSQVVTVLSILTNIFALTNSLFNSELEILLTYLAFVILHFDSHTQFTNILGILYAMIKKLTSFSTSTSFIVNNKWEINQCI